MSTLNAEDIGYINTKVIKWLTMDQTNKRYDGLYFCIFLIICVAPIVGFRDYTVGSDTPAYARHIADYLAGYRGNSKAWEPGIYALASISGIFSKSPQVFFTFHFVLLSYKKHFGNGW
mgnify:CR=1 FL=1